MIGMGAACFHVCQSEAAAPKAHGMPKDLLVSPHRCLNVARIKLYHPGDATRSLSCNQRGARAGEGIYNDITALCAVQQNVGQKGYRFGCRVNTEPFATFAKAAGAGIIPAIAPVPTVSAQLYVVAVRGAGRPIDQKQFMSAPVH